MVDSKCAARTIRSVIEASLEAGLTNDAGTQLPYEWCLESHPSEQAQRLSLEALWQERALQVHTGPSGNTARFGMLVESRKWASLPTRAWIGHGNGPSSDAGVVQFFIVAVAASRLGIIDLAVRTRCPSKMRRWTACAFATPR